MTVFSIIFIILQKFTNFHAIRLWNFQNICNEIGWPRFCATLYRANAIHWSVSNTGHNSTQCAAVRPLVRAALALPLHMLLARSWWIDFAHSCWRACIRGMFLTRLLSFCRASHCCAHRSVNYVCLFVCLSVCLWHLPDAAKPLYTYCIQKIYRCLDEKFVIFDQYLHAVISETIHNTHRYIIRTC